ncbi:TrmH family RNA methyltransferase [Candidatus Enterococcus leclercqii]|uniref:TrmH family RNA methyltransferase n=1 Tax=Candidatus Enterococcus leclercqii TaxID=1857218 RepID=UPI00137B8F77|nr:RNA methyltransferase [Enterococcus sp. CU9D]KAF1291951.1 23S rRNA methyltransferase [Enterococcus sp. CU9D]
MKEIQAVKNPLIKELRKLHQKKHRQEQGRFLLEGFHLVEEAAENQAAIQMILVNQRGLQEWQEWLQRYETLEQYLVSDEVMDSLSDLPTPQGIIAVVSQAQPIADIKKGRWLLLDRVQDPGNVGTMVRTADAAGFSGVILGAGCADPFSTKVLRSMQGSNFHLPILNGALETIIPELKAAGMTVYGTELNEAARPFQTVENEENVALLMGNEGQGVARNLLEMTDLNLYIPIYGKAESLNVGVAAGILMYHFSGNFF